MLEKTRPCEVCRKLIDPERAEALPDTSLCKEHADQLQKYGGEFIISVTHERTSKAGSLKRNYGGVTPSKTRNQRGLEKLIDEYTRQQG